MLKKLLALLVVCMLCIGLAACGSEDGTKERTSDPAQNDGKGTEEKGRASEDELINDVFRCIIDSGEFDKVEDCFDKAMTGAFLLTTDIQFAENFDAYYQVAADFDKGADYLAENYPEFAEAFEEHSGKPLSELYDEYANKIDGEYSAISTTVAQVHDECSLQWSGVNDGTTYDKDFGIKEYSVLTDYDYERDGAPAITGVNLYYIEMNDRYYAVFLSTSVGGGRGA